MEDKVPPRGGEMLALGVEEGVALDDLAMDPLAVTPLVAVPPSPSPPCSAPGEGVAKTDSVPLELMEEETLGLGEEPPRDGVSIALLLGSAVGEGVDSSERLALGLEVGVD